MFGASVMPELYATNGLALNVFAQSGFWIKPVFITRTDAVATGVRQVYPHHLGHPWRYRAPQDLHAAIPVTLLAGVVGGGVLMIP